MADIGRLFDNRVLGTAIISWAIAQLIKIALYSVQEKRLDFSRLVGSGGMPSSHSAFVVAMSFAIGYQSGFDSSVFALSAAFALVVMVDAAGVRRAAGTQAKLLNRMVVDLIEQGHLPEHETLKELLGHTPVEVFAGAALGVLVATWWMRVLAG